MFVCRRARLVTGAGRGGSGSGGDRRAVDALQPGARPLELVEARGAGRGAPDEAQAIGARLGDDAVAERLAELVLAQFEVQPEEPGEQVAEAGAPLPARVETPAQLGELEAERRRARVHNVLGMPLDD